ncbi:MAG: TIGR03089 family protein [Natronosporangium sp.]
MRVDTDGPATVPAAFAAATADPARPLLTWYDDGTGERVELSGATCANWLAKTANLLVDGVGLAAPATAVVDAPPHWQTAVIMLGCWSAGLAVAPPGEVDAEVVFAAADRVVRYPTGTGGELFALALAPLAAPLREVPPGTADYVVEVRAYGDHFAPPAPVRPEDPATPERSHAELCRAATARAAALGIVPGARVLIDVTAHPDPTDWLLAPLLAGASTVLCGHPDAGRLPDRIAAERVTVSLTASA